LLLSHRAAFALTAEIRCWAGTTFRETRVGFGFGFGFGFEKIATTVIEMKVVQSGLTITINLLPT
jgi:hypothetical protein